MNKVFQERQKKPVHGFTMAKIVHNILCAKEQSRRYDKHPTMSFFTAASDLHLDKQKNPILDGIETGSESNLVSSITLFHYSFVDLHHCQLKCPTSSGLGCVLLEADCPLMSVDDEDASG